MKPIMLKACLPKPLTIPLALITYGLSALPFWLGLHYILPKLVRSGFSVTLSLSIAFLTPLTMLLIAATIFGRREQVTHDWQGLRARWRLAAIRKIDLAWATALLSVTLVGYFGLAGTTDWFQTKLGIVPPPEFDLVSTASSFWGIQLAGHWWVALIHLGIVVLNVAGEELWFRGVLFPKQEVVHGSQTWLVHGICYHLFHMFYPWDFVRLLPESIMYGWVAQKSRSTWPSIFSHFMFNGIGIIITVSNILAQ